MNANALLPRLSTLPQATRRLCLPCPSPCSYRPRAQTVVVLVNGEPITSLDIEQRTKLMALTTHKQAKNARRSSTN